MVTGHVWSGRAQGSARPLLRPIGMKLLGLACSAGGKGRHRSRWKPNQKDQSLGFDKADPLVRFYSNKRSSTASEKELLTNVGRPVGRPPIPTTRKTSDKGPGSGVKVFV
eukprot:TRINITY_DN7547_c0_g1_i2.p1 TRINITY_DN7547_c0_g1~~TRINITY_DN7547_c0_g1_i2.p1  ORF type:complete len:110 (+),score=7.01 TRINITY_DN7547_c0_g1_i2:119-448(+)